MSQLPRLEPNRAPAPSTSSQPQSKKATQPHIQGTQVKPTVPLQPIDKHPRRAGSLPKPTLPRIDPTAKPKPEPSTPWIPVYAPPAPAPARSQTAPKAGASTAWLKQLVPSLGPPSLDKAKQPKRADRMWIE